MAGIHFKAIVGVALLVGCKPSAPVSEATCVGVHETEDLLHGIGPVEVGREERDARQRLVALGYTWGDDEQWYQVEAQWTYEGDHLVREERESIDDKGDETWSRSINVWDPLNRLQTVLGTWNEQGRSSGSRLENTYLGETDNLLEVQEWVEEELYSTLEYRWLDGRQVSMVANGGGYVAGGAQIDWAYDRAAPDQDHLQTNVQAGRTSTFRRTYDTRGNLTTEHIEDGFTGISRTEWSVWNHQNLQVESRRRRWNADRTAEVVELNLWDYDDDGRVVRREGGTLDTEGYGYWTDDYTWTDEGLPLTHLSFEDRDGEGKDHEYLETWSWDCGAAN